MPDSIHLLTNEIIHHWLLFAITQIICAYANYTRYVISRMSSEKMVSRLSFIQRSNFVSVWTFLVTIIP